MWNSHSRWFGEPDYRPSDSSVWPRYFYVLLRLTKNNFPLDGLPSDSEASRTHPPPVRHASIHPAGPMLPAPRRPTGIALQRPRTRFRHLDDVAVDLARPNRSCRSGVERLCSRDRDRQAQFSPTQTWLVASRGFGGRLHRAHSVGRRGQLRASERPSTPERLPLELLLFAIVRVSESCLHFMTGV